MSERGNCFFCGESLILFSEHWIDIHGGRTLGCFTCYWVITGYWSFGVFSRQEQKYDSGSH